MARIAILAPDAAEDARPAAPTRALLPLLAARGHRSRLVLPEHEDAFDLARTADLAVYHLADAPAFADALRMAVRVPGLVILHEVSLERLVAWMLGRGDPVAVRARREARAAGAHLGERAPDEPPRLFWPAYPARRAGGLVVPSAEARDLVRASGSLTPAWISAMDADGAPTHLEAIEGTLALVRDPVRGSIARWARALTELGVSEQAAARGLGMRLPRALDSLTQD